MDERAVSLEEMLEAREQRALRQRELLGEGNCPLICLTMNIAGPVKQSGLIRRGFEYGCELLEDQLSASGLSCKHSELSHSVTGSLGFWLVDADASELKRLTVEIEDGAPIGRLFDMDVLDERGEHLDRTALGFPERKCLICGKPAKECARSRTHTVDELWERSMAILEGEFARQKVEKIASLACRSLLYEVCVTPKPGLVDRQNNGSHTDMDIFSFMSSASALGPWFERFARIGAETAALPPSETFKKLRWPGKRAEKAMLSATGGVNTHKGAIFSLGILCAALGRLDMERWRDTSAVLDQCAALVKGVTETDFRGVTAENARTTGQRLYALYGEAGVRGEAERGFPTVREYGLPVLERELRRGLSINDAGCAALLAIMSQNLDTNLAARGDYETAQSVRGQIEELMRVTPSPGLLVLQRLDRSFIEKNLSPGGSADLLAITYFLHFLKE